jgi:hypothetical protein
LSEPRARAYRLQVRLLGVQSQKQIERRRVGLARGRLVKHVEAERIGLVVRLRNL